MVANKKVVKGENFELLAQKMLVSYKEKMSALQFDKIVKQLTKMMSSRQKLVENAAKRNQNEVKKEEVINVKVSFEQKLSMLISSGCAYRFTRKYDLKAIANLMGLNLVQMQEIFTSGRFFSQIGEETATVFGFELFEHKDVGGADGFFIGLNDDGFIDDFGVKRVLSSAGNLDFVSVKGMGKSNKVCLQLSSLTGKNRSNLCDKTALLDSIKLTKWICVTKTDTDGVATFTLFPNTWAINWVKNGILTSSGLCAEKFEQVLQKSGKVISIQNHQELMMKKNIENNN